MGRNCAEMCSTAIPRVLYTDFRRSIKSFLFVDRRICTHTLTPFQRHKISIPPRIITFHLTIRKSSQTSAQSPNLRPIAQWSVAYSAVIVAYGFNSVVSCIDFYSLKIIFIKIFCVSSTIFIMREFIGVLFDARE